VSTGEQRRDAGVAAVNETVADNLAFTAWRIGAKQHILDALKHGPLTLEAALEGYAAPPPGFPPNGIGALAIGLAKAGRIMGAGYARAAKESRHAGVVRVWLRISGAAAPPPALQS